jgi:deoxyribodipyrimidine photolyase-related protein
MSNYCEGCAYDPRIKSGPKACPFNPLYWDFLMRNRKALHGNPRLAMPYKTLDAMSAERKREIAADAKAVLESAEFCGRPGLAGNSRP